MRRPVRPPLLGTGVLLAVALVAAGATLAPAHAKDRWPVPAKARIVVQGHGYGHGHGMSQHGAQGAALAGRTHRQILRFYYPGTSTGSVRGGVKVRISADTDDDVVVRARPGLTVRDTAGGGRVPLPANGARQWRIKRVPSGRQRVSYRTDRWRRWRDLDGEGEFFARGAKPIALVVPSGVRKYRGRLRAASGDTVNIVSMDDYLKGVVPLEMPALWHPAAVRSQAVAARTYAAYERAHPRAAHYQICDTTSCQVYGGVDAEHPAASRAVEQTSGQILTHRGRPAFTQFSASSGGWTSAGSMPYLRAKRDPYDGWSGNPHHSWRVTVTDRRVERAFPWLGNLRRIVVRGRDGNGQWGGRIGSVRLVGSKGARNVSADTFRFALGLKSTWITLRVRRR